MAAVVSLHGVAALRYDLLYSPESAKLLVRLGVVVSCVERYGQAAKICCQSLLQFDC